MYDAAMNGVLPELRGPHVTLRVVAARDRTTIARLPLEPDFGRFFGEELPERRLRTADEVEELYGWLAEDDEPFRWVVALDREFIGTAGFHHFWEDQPRARASPSRCTMRRVSAKALAPRRRAWRWPAASRCWACTASICA